MLRSKFSICVFAGFLLLSTLLCGTVVCGQVVAAASSGDTATTDGKGKLFHFPSRFLSRIQGKAAAMNKQLTDQTEKYLQRMERREQKLRRKLQAVDSTSAKALFANSSQQYAALAARIRTDTGTKVPSISGSYQPYVDSLHGSLAFLQKNPQLLNGAGAAQLQGASSQLQALQGKMQDADQAKAFIQQRQQQIGQYISQHANVQTLLGKSYAGMNQDVYYYSQQIRQYKEMLNNPDVLTKKALTLLGQLPAWQQFMKNNSQLGSLFSLPGNYGSPQGLTGLQTKEQVGQLVQNQVASAGGGGAAALQANLQSAESQLDTYKSKLSQLGTGNGDLNMPDFNPNDQKTKTFWHRLEYGTNFQTTHNNYYFPTVTDLGLSLGYQLGHSNVVGVGASYKIGWGNGIQHITLSSQGVGLRSYLDVKVKGSFSATGSFEYNYTTPFTSFQQIRQIQRWTRSGLIGISKTVSMKSRVLKKTKVQLLWDFLSYQQVPKTQPILFRVGYVLQ